MPPDPTFELTIRSPAFGPLAKLDGTTTFAKETLAGLARQHGVGETGCLELPATLGREADEPSAVSVYIDGKRIGCLPQYIDWNDGLITQLSDVPVQMFAELLPKGLRVEAWVWLGRGLPEWEWSAENRPLLSPEAKAAEHQRETDARVRESIAAGGSRAEEVQAGIVGGVHYLQTVEPIKQLKREGRFDEALALCYTAIEGAERSGAYEKFDPPYWYTEQAAIIHRKRKEHGLEIAVLERWLAACSPKHRAGHPIQLRLDKLRK